MLMRSDQFYPFTLTESRYGGIYEGGQYVVIAGVRRPREMTAAFAGDVPCGEFWEKVRNEGPVITVELPDEHPEDETYVYADSGSHPSVLYEKFEDFKREIDFQHDNSIINTVIQDHLELYEIAVDGDELSRHALAAMAGMASNTSVGEVQMRIINRMLSERFPGDTKNFYELSEQEQEEVRKIISENATGIIPFFYRMQGE